ncbi:MAG TPA: helicase-related protein [Rhizomicrobium sp.]|jgi:ATP-dependent RNA helicase SUPV3L1/SUV3|nr:helicase-related protein [Rhizomicrobium sp.]
MIGWPVTRRAIPSLPGGRVGAVLGPTNTGKTHFAIERMLAHRSGMIGLPLRLLAREIYDKVVRIKGAPAAALITGEEKIVPPQAQYFVCTVESMPLDLKVAFLAVDEIQLCADAERGHVFTHRLLHARGEEETLFLGAETMRSAIQRFVPEAHFVTRPRFSDLAYTGHKKLTRLPRRSAIVVFSAEDVYGIAELVRRQRGGAAVVLGALSPRTRNAQVALYQSGDVDFLVATDAIGMGLNMDIDHISFARMDKFDGIGTRRLRADEVGQIAGRAGRHMNDGTFGSTADCEVPDEETIARVEAHRYEPVRQLQWRNSALNFRSLDALAESLDVAPPQRGLARARSAMDAACLSLLASRDEIAAMAQAPAAIKLLWESCQVPDFRKLSVEEHANLVEQIYRHLMGPEGSLPDDWLERHVARLDDSEGDVATLSGRLAQIRTWTYAAHRPGWVKDAAHWQEQTRAVEDRLSDALHERLTQRFIDRRTSILLRSLRDDELHNLRIDDSGAVLIGGEAVGKLDGFRFTPDPRAEGVHGRTLRAAAIKALEGEFSARAQRLIAADDTQFSLSEHGRVWWEGAIVARLGRGPSPLEPSLAMLADEQLATELRDGVTARLRTWLTLRIETRLAPLWALRRAADAKAGTPDAIPAAARGIAHQLCEHWGSLDREKATVPSDLRAARAALRPYGVTFGRRSIFLSRLLRPDAAGLLAILWGAGRKQAPASPPPGLTSFDPEPWLKDDFLAAAGFRRVGRRAIRIDILERLEDELEGAARSGATADMLRARLLSLLGTSDEALDDVLEHLEWTSVPVVRENGDPAVSVLRRKTWRSVNPTRRGRKRAPAPADSPFAQLASLIPAD